MRRTWILVGVLVCLAILFAVGKRLNHRNEEEPAATKIPDAKRTVVVYTALDRVFSEPIFSEFEKATGVKVLAKYDTESTKTIGLVNAIRAEAERPRCDVFWNNEIVGTLRLKNQNLLEQYGPQAAADYPEIFKDPEGYWTVFAARARVLIVNTDIVKQDEMPDSIFDLADEKWKGKTGIAKPLFGTTATHAACLFAYLGEKKAQAFFKSLKDNDIAIEAGNKSCAESVSAGILAFGITDTDDAIIEVEGGKPVTIVYPDSRQGQLGTLFIPNTLAIVKGAPHPEEAKLLIEYLLSPEVEIALAECPSAQIPLGRSVDFKARVRTPEEIKAMDVDFARAAEEFAAAADYIEKYFLK